MDNTAPVEIIYQGPIAFDESVIYQQEFEKKLKQKLALPSPIVELDAMLGFNEVIITLILASIGKALALSLLEFIENRVVEKKKEMEQKKNEIDVEFRIQLIIKKNPTDIEEPSFFDLKKITQKALSEIFNKIREKISYL